VNGDPSIRAPVVHVPPGEAQEGRRRALFLDRDGVINVNHGYVHTPEATDWIDGIFELVRQANASGFLPIVVTNQAGIARGYYDEQAFRAYTRWMHDVFSAREAPLAATYYCPHHPDFGDRIDCACRKPHPGLLLAAGDDYRLDLARSLMIGDKPGDIEAARRAGVGEALLLAPESGDGTPEGVRRIAALADAMPLLRA